MKLLSQVNIKDKFAPANNFENIGNLINTVIPIFITGAALIFLGMALYGGYIWITSGGTQENLNKAQKIFTSAIIGLFIVFFAFVLIKIIGYILQINIF